MDIFGLAISSMVWHELPNNEPESEEAAHRLGSTGAADGALELAPDGSS